MRSNVVPRVTWPLVLVAVCILLSGCGGNKRVNKENLALIKDGMTLSEVETVLGRGQPEGGEIGLAEGSSGAGAAGIGGDLSSVSRPASSGTKWVKWGDDKKYIRVGFDGDRVSKGKIQSQGL